MDVRIQQCLVLGISESNGFHKKAWVWQYQEAGSCILKWDRIKLMKQHEEHFLGMILVYAMVECRVRKRTQLTVQNKLLYKGITDDYSPVKLQVSAFNIYTQQLSPKLRHWITHDRASVTPFTFYCIFLTQVWKYSPIPPCRCCSRTHLHLLSHDHCLCDS